MKILVGMSGGVDSSVAAFLMKQQGHDVTGVTFRIWDQRIRTDSTLCCTEEAVRAAASVCRTLHIEHRCSDTRRIFGERVVEPFCSAYLEGQTPNPCVLCNRHVKFRHLLELADEVGADAVATGHYARIKTEGEGLRLLKGCDPVKDQSYFLYVMRAKELSRTLFPLGELTKETVRAIAADAGLPTAERAESQEICFVGPGGYRDFIAALAPERVRPGPFIDLEGRTIGRHRGIARYTIGQRRGLGVAAGERLYVLQILPDRNAVVLGPRSAALRSTLRVQDLHWIAPPPMDRTAIQVRIRSTMKEVPAQIEPCSNGSLLVRFSSPQWAPAPGQAAVFYRDDIVLGGGTIVEESSREDREDI